MVTVIQRLVHLYRVASYEKNEIYRDLARTYIQRLRPHRSSQHAKIIQQDLRSHDLTPQQKEILRRVLVPTLDVANTVHYLEKSPSYIAIRDVPKDGMAFSLARQAIRKGARSVDDPTLWRSVHKIRAKSLETDAPPC